LTDDIIDHTVLDGPLAGFLSASHWYLGLSGGVDSTVLLHLLIRWRRSCPQAPELTALHINHGMQSAASEWQSHCEWVCRLLRVPFIARRVEVHPGSGGGEAAAREARYAVFEELLEDDATLFLGHHLDDQVETFFLRLLRGAGVQGLAGVPAERPLGRGRVVRPLLQVTRAQLEAYASQHGLSCVEDPSNADTALDRNFLRAELLPLLAERWPGYRRTVSRASEHMAVAAATLEELLPLPETVFSALGDPGLPLTALLGKRDAAAQAMRAWLQSQGLPAPDQSALEEFLRQLRESDGDASPRLHCRTFTLQRYREAVYLVPDSGSAPKLPEVALKPGAVRELAGVGRVALCPAEGAGLALAEDEVLIVGWRRGGERCRPVGRGRSTSLKKLLQESDVPPWWRDRVPLLSLTEELLAVGDLWLCASSRFREQARPGEALWQLSWDRLR
jgi:tRNA(Ile)-lysidine synthase